MNQYNLMEKEHRSLQKRVDGEITIPTVLIDPSKVEKKQKSIEQLNRNNSPKNSKTIQPVPIKPEEES